MMEQNARLDSALKITSRYHAIQSDCQKLKEDNNRDEIGKKEDNPDTKKVWNL